MLIKSEKCIGVMFIKEVVTVFVLLNGDRAESHRNRLSVSVNVASRFHLMSDCRSMQDNRQD